MKVIIAGITETGRKNLQELLDSSFNADGRIVIDRVEETLRSDQIKMTRVEISLPDSLAIKAGDILQAVSGEAVATITL